MSTPARIAEAEKASVAFHLALVQIGVETAAAALSLWKSDAVSTRPASAGAWMGKVIALIFKQRTRARDLARSYYRLVRALRTDATIPDFSEPDATSSSLNDLRQDFKSQVGKVPVQLGSDDSRIKVEALDSSKSASATDKAIQDEIKTALGNLGPVSLNDALDSIDTEKPASDVDAERQSASDQAGARQAAAAARIAMNGARHELSDLVNRDGKAIGYIRLSRTGTPCGWCAMLISRGPVYKTQRSAEVVRYTEGDQYHDNCNCYAEPVFSDKEYKTSNLYRLNREYAEQWPKVTRGLSGKSAVSAWRRYIRTQQRALAARANPQTTQEA